MVVIPPLDNYPLRFRTTLWRSSPVLYGDSMSDILSEKGRLVGMTVNKARLHQVTNFIFVPANL